MAPVATAVLSGVAVGLVQRADGGTDVLHFADDSGLNVLEAGHQSDDQQRRNNDQFGRNDEPVVIVNERAKGIHRRGPLDRDGSSDF